MPEDLHKTPEDLHKTPEEIAQDDDSGVISLVEELFIAAICLIIGGAIAWLVL